MNKRNRKRLEKLIFAILARNPYEYGIVPDENGWIRLKDLHYALMQGEVFRSISVKGLEQYFDLYRPDRMELSGRYVRVLPEFQAPGLLAFPQVSPPARLYVPVRPRAHAHVLRRGMRPNTGAKWIVLWPDMEKALVAGRRRDRDPLVGIINTDVAQSCGGLFFMAGGEIFLSQWLEPSWLELPPLPESEERQAVQQGRQRYSTRKDAVSQDHANTPGSFIPTFPSQWPGLYGDGDVKARRGRGKKGDRKRKKGAYRRDRHIK